VVVVVRLVVVVVGSVVVVVRSVVGGFRVVVVLLPQVDFSGKSHFFS